MQIRDFIDRIRSDSRCNVRAPSGLPVIPGNLALPEDLAEFYRLCGGAALFEGEVCTAEIVPPGGLVQANPVLAGGDDADDISTNWFILCRGLNDEQYVTIDLARDRLGRCYDSFWDRHAIAGSCEMVARSFSEFLDRLMRGGGKRWYWLEDSFVSLGDAYD